MFMSVLIGVNAYIKSNAVYILAILQYVLYNTIQIKSIGEWQKILYIGDNNYLLK